MPKNENKKSFIIYSDWERYFLALSDQQAGMLLKALFAFVSRDEEIELEPMAQMAFMFMSDQIIRDTQKWEEVCEKKRVLGARGGKARGKNINASKEKQIEANASNEMRIEADASKEVQNEARASKEVQIEAGASNEMQNEANQADTVTDTVTETETVTDTVTDTETVTDTVTETETDINREQSSAFAAGLSVGLSMADIRALISKCDESTFHHYVRKLRSWSEKTGKKCSDPVFTIGKWIEEDKAKQLRSPNYESLPDKPSYDLSSFEEFADSFDLSRYKKDNPN